MLEHDIVVNALKGMWGKHQPPTWGRWSDPADLATMYGDPFGALIDGRPYICHTNGYAMLAVLVSTPYDHPAARQEFADGVPKFFAVEYPERLSLAALGRWLTLEKIPCDKCGAEEQLLAKRTFPGELLGRTFNRALLLRTLSPVFGLRIWGPEEEDIVEASASTGEMTWLAMRQGWWRAALMPFLVRESDGPLVNYGKEQQA